jgi:starch phosphorylase
MSMARYLYWGCDVWLNNPLRPLEACGTSGMKSALNGGLNLSIRDGWWDELYDGANGWAIPTADGVDDPHRATTSRRTRSTSCSPRRWRRRSTTGPHGVPTGWVELVRHTLTTLRPQVQATRMVREYVEDWYIPAAARRGGSRENFAPARELAAFRTRLNAAWPLVEVLGVDASGLPDTPVVGAADDGARGGGAGGLDPSDVAVEAWSGRGRRGPTSSASP